MGVHGLWRLIEPSGKPVPVESLENKILAVDVSIWLHQAIKGFQDAKGAPAVNAHLLGIFHRVCKLLYFKVKPVFVFDGGVPTLKKETIAKRNKLKYKNLSDADKIQKQLLNTLIKHSAVNKVLAEKAKAAVESTSPTKSNANESDNLFKLPEIKIDSTRSSSDEEQDSESAETDSGSPSKHWNLHNIDTKSEHFKLLPADVRHEILTDLKETRKQSSWGRLHELPTKSDDFAGFQMRRLLKRQEVQVALEEAEKEMGGHSLSLGELEEILKDQGVITKNSIGARIASDENTRYLYIRNIKQALEKARLDEEKKITSMKKEESSVKEVENDEENKPEKFSEKSTKADLELEEDLQKAIVLSLQDQPSSSGYTGRKKISEYSFLENFKDEDFETDESDEHESPDTLKISKLVAAQNYMIEYSGLNPNEIAKIISNNEGKISTKRKLKELNDEYLADQVDSKNKILKINSTNTGINLGTEDQETEVSGVSNTELKKSEVVDNSDYLEVISKQNIQCSSNTLNETLEDNFEKVQVLSDMIESSKMKADDPEISNAMQVQSDQVTVMSESEESEGDFNEVEDISFKETSSDKHVNVLEIKIETEDYVADDDLFADIFTPKIDEKIEDKTESKPLGDPVVEEPIMNKIDELKMNQIDEPIQLISETSIKQKVSNEDISDSKELLSKREPINLNEGSRLKLSDEELMKMKESLSKQQLELRNEQGLRERLGTNITDQMYKEAQDLLELFGLPYIVAPMEAEAQCAFLELASLTDGTITDDSDIWLFGGKTVYKNFFNQSKHVLEYRAEDIKHHFKLSREQMILLALLVGSDYTTGLQGVGPVTALEILAAFPSSCTASLTLSHEQLLIGLSEFKSWFTQSKNVARGKNSLRNKLKNVIFTDSFPSVQVVQAYLNPTVDTSEEKFSWSKPDFEGLSDFGRNKFGWSRNKSEEILKPVIKKIKESKYQSNLLNYFKIKHNLNAEEAQKLMSERVKSAVKKIGQDPKEDEDDENLKEKTKKKSKKIEKCDENLKGKITPKNKRKKSYSKHIDDIAKKQEKSIDVETHDLANKQKKIKIVKKTTKSNLKHIKDKTETHRRNSKNLEKIDSRDKTVLFSDDEFVDVDKLESFLDSVENEAKSARKNQKPIKKASKKFKEKNIPQSPQLPKTNVAIKNIELNYISNEELLNKDNIKMQSESHKDFNSIKCIKDKPEDSTASSTSINVEKDFKNTTLEYEVKDNSNMDTFKYVSQLVKEKYVVKKVEKEKIEKANKKLKTECENSASASKPNFSDKLDDELKLLKKTEILSQKRIEEIKKEAENKLQKEINKKKLITRKLHRKEVIPQREQDQKNVMRTRLRAIEVFRKSNIDPSRKKGVGYKVRTAKEDAGLSESSSDSDL
ncbi:hypothetical protein WA026_006774 [Henosepilachna vigintioctopunctata]|uniref:DNA repair protein complementing XP-G cells n=1 Tax=Henosepilachna vigintioctopunctata TaxID=420089 RepID=A0AAW1UGB2_9CUCU